MTGVPVNGKLVNLVYDGTQQAFWEVASEYIPARYPGTGDIFASVLLGCLLRRESLATAVRRAADFVSYAIKTKPIRWVGPAARVCCWKAPCPGCAAAPSR